MWARRDDLDYETCNGWSHVLDSSCRRRWVPVPDQFHEVWKIKRFRAAFRVSHLNMQMNSNAGHWAAGTEEQAGGEWVMTSVQGCWVVCLWPTVELYSAARYARLELRRKVCPEDINNVKCNWSHRSWQYCLRSLERWILNLIRLQNS